MALASLLIPYLPVPGQIWGVSSYSPSPQRPLVCLSPIEVNDCTNCPNIYCAPHTYYFNVIKPCLKGTSQLLIQHFHPNYNPFPNDKQYKIVEAPSTLLEHGCQMYIPGSG